MVRKRPKSYLRRSWDDDRRISPVEVFVGVCRLALFNFGPWDSCNGHGNNGPRVKTVQLVLPTCMTKVL